MAHPGSSHRPARLALLAGFAFPALLLNAARLSPAADETPTEPIPETTPPLTDTPAPSDTPTPAETPTPTSTEPSTPTQSETPTLGAGPTDTPSATVEAPHPTPYPALSVMINEVAWSGTLASASDEWIELVNPGDSAIDLAGWAITDGNDLNHALAGIMPPHSYFLLERTDDGTVSDVPADRIYAGALNDSGETLRLLDPSGQVIDTANADGGGWPAGGGSARASMERRGGEDIPGNWLTFAGAGAAHDAGGNSIAGTPRAPNALAYPTPTPTQGLTPYPPLSILINEVAWAGTRGSSSDEWIELYNASSAEIDLSGWTLTDGNDLLVHLEGMLSAGGFFLLERTDDSTISDLPADQIYSGGLNNSGEGLWLRDPTGALIDSANGDGGGWPAGSGSGASMERRGGEDSRGAWGTFTGYFGAGHDCDGNPIAGTPLSPNSIFFPTPVATWVPGRVVINEVLIRPHYDWEGAGEVTPGDEFIELHNLGPSPVYLSGWILDDGEDTGSRPYTIPGITISPGGFASFFRTRTRIALNDSGDVVRLLGPRGDLIDSVRYLRVRAYNLSFGRLPDGSDYLAYGLWPTPGRANLLFREPTPVPILSPDCPSGGIPHARLPRLGRHPAVARWMASLGLAVCW